MVKFGVVDDLRVRKNAYPYLPRVTTESDGADDVILLDPETEYTFDVHCGDATFTTPDIRALV